MHLDSLGRRHRTKSQPLGARIELSDRDVRLINALRRHNPLPTPLAYYFWRGDASAHYNSFQDRMKKLFHGASGTGPLLTRPEELNPRHGPNPEPAWYELSDLGERIAWDATSAPRVLKRDPRHHRAMGGCITASFEILAPQHGLSFVHHEDIFLHPKCPRSTREALNPIHVDGYEPDALFGLRHVDTKRAYFFVGEWDRGTESFVREDKLQNSILQKIDKLTRIFAGRLYDDVWGIPNLRALFVFTSERRIATALRHLDGHPLADRFLFRALPDFSRFAWRAPRAPIEALFLPWRVSPERRAISLVG